MLYLVFLNIWPLNRRQNLMKSFINSQFDYSPLIWMIHNRGVNNKIHHIHKRALRIVYDNCSSGFDHLLNNKPVTIHQRTLQQLVIESFKVEIWIAPITMKKNSYLFWKQYLSPKACVRYFLSNFCFLIKW